MSLLFRYSALILCAFCTVGQGQGPVGPRGAVPAKETLQYDVEWRLISAGSTKVTWSPVQKADSQTPAGWKAQLHLESTGLISRLFKVNDDYTVNLSSDLCAENVYMMAREGSRQRETKITFDPSQKKASYLERDLVKNATVQKEVGIPSCVHDIVSGLYVLRGIHLEPGKSAEIPISTGKKTASVKVEAQVREEVKTPFGTEKAIRYEVNAFNDVLYQRPGHLFIWLTDDKRRIPIQIQIRLTFTIGTITLRLRTLES